MLLISPDESEDDSPEKYLIGCVVAHGPAHTPQCSNASCDLGVDEEEVSNKKNNHRCYMCCGHPFVEVRISCQCCIAFEQSLLIYYSWNRCCSTTPGPHTIMTMGWKRTAISCSVPPCQ